VLLFLVNGDLSVVSLFLGELVQYQSYIAQSLVYVAILGFAGVAMKTEALSWKSIGISRGNLVKALPVLLTLFMGTVAVAVYSGDWNRTSALSGTASTSVLLLIFIGFGSFVEEYVFRGYVQNGTARAFGVTAGIVVSASVFSLSHIPTDVNGLDLNSGPANLIMLLSVSAIGRFFFGVLAFSTIYYLTGNFFITYFTHVFYDLSYFLLPAGGSLAYRAVCVVVPYVTILALQGRRGFLPAKEPLLVGLPKR